VTLPNTFFSANRIERSQDLAFGAVADAEVSVFYAVRFIACPDDLDAGGTIDTGFDPVAVPNNLTFWAAAISQLKVNNESIIWNILPISATHAGWGLYDDPVLRGPTHLVAVAAFGAPETTSAGFPPYVSPGDFSLRFKNKSPTIFPGDYLSNKLLDHRLGGVTFVPAANLTRRTYTVPPDAENLGGVESTYSGYTPMVDANSLVTWAAAAGRIKANAIDMEWPVSTGTAENTAAAAFLDGTNLYLVCTPAVPVPVVNTKGPKIPAGGLDWELSS
jgi:hypothetical protein